MHYDHVALKGREEVQTSSTTLRAKGGSKLKKIANLKRSFEEPKGVLSSLLHPMTIFPRARA